MERSGKAKPVLKGSQSDGFVSEAALSSRLGRREERWGRGLRVAVQAVRPGRGTLLPSGEADLGGGSEGEQFCGGGAVFLFGATGAEAVRAHAAGGPCGLAYKLSHQFSAAEGSGMEQ